MSPKIIVIVGITGNQGSSVAETFLQEPGWKVRGITRDPTKPSAVAWSDRGAEVVAGDLDDVSSMKDAFKDANVIFGNTDFLQHLNDSRIIALAKEQNRAANELAVEREFSQAKNLIDAAAANVQSLDRFIFSSLSDTKGWSKGKIQYNLHFDVKWSAVEYLRKTYPKLGYKTSLLQLGIFMSNWKMPIYTPRKQADGSFKVQLPMAGGAKFPIVDPNADTGPLTKALVQIGPGKHLVGAGLKVSWDEWCETWGRLTGVKCTFEKIDRKVLEDAYGPFGREIADMFQYMDEFGYDGGDPDVVYPWDLEIEVKTTSLGEYIQRQDWSSVL